MRTRFGRQFAVLMGVSLCAAAAGLGAALFVSRPSQVVVPLAFAVVVVGLAMRYGAAVGIYGSLVAAFIFAYFLFAPVHSLRIESPVARANLGWMLLAGISLSYLLGGQPHEKS